MADWPIGLSTGCFLERPIGDVLPAVQAAGFTRLEICSFPAHLDYHDEPACRAAGRRLRELGLEAISFHAPFAEWIDITAPDDGDRARARRELFAAAAAAASVGARHLVVHPGPEKHALPRWERLDRMERAACELDLLAARCRDLGVGLLLENMLPHLFSGAVRELLWLLGALAADVDVCLDVGHAFLAGDLLGIAHKLGGHIGLVHANDNHGTRDDHLPPGEGSVPWPALLQRLAADGFRGEIVLEIAGRGSIADTLAAAQAGRSRLRDLVAALETQVRSWEA